MQWITQWFSDTGGRSLLKAGERAVPAIAAFEAQLSALSDEELTAKTNQFREAYRTGTSIDALLPEAFATVREASRRVTGQRHYDVQMIGGYVLHHGGIAEMRTGEGKTLVATLPTYLNALAGRGVHVITVNDYLSRRDAVWMGQIYSFLGMSVGVISAGASYVYDASIREHTSPDAIRDETGSFHVVHEFLRPVTRQEAYQCDITYGTNSEFGFDYLRDNLEYDAARLRQREHAFAIVDEVDSILIDEARTPLIISAPAQESEDLYAVCAQIAERMEQGADFEVDEKLKAISITEKGIEKAEGILNVGNIYTDKGVKYVHHLETAVKAKALYVRDREYVVRDGQIIIVDEFTGRMQPGRRWSEGLHQAIEAKERVPVQRESRTVASITYQNYFRMYERLAGMTGTAITSAEEFYSVYKLTVVSIPTHRPIARVDHDDLIFQTERGKLRAIARHVKALHEKGQPVLIGTVSIEKNEELSTFLHAEGVPHEMLNAKNHEREGEIIAQAGRAGVVTIATNMAGRGVDIKLGGNPAPEGAYDAVKNNGGLFVIGTERHEARRIDNQLRGRSGRQGDPGATQFFVSMEDSLMRVFAADMVKKMMGRLNIPEDEPIQNGLITRSLESAQSRIEGFHFDARKRVLSFDDVLNRQRQAIYQRRRALVVSPAEAVEAYLAEITATDAESQKAVKEKAVSMGADSWVQSVRRIMLSAIDTHWLEHLDTMEYLRRSVGLRAYGQRDPLIEYRKEGLRMFRAMEASIGHSIIEAALSLTDAAPLIPLVPPKIDSDQSGDSLITRRYGRNDEVTITNGIEIQQMKFKKAEPLLAQGWKIVA
jgi:preprotein translocase subunit SecA